MLEIEAAIDADRKKLLDEKDMVESERQRLELELQKREGDLDEARWARPVLTQICAIMCF